MSEENIKQNVTYNNFSFSVGKKESVRQKASMEEDLFWFDM